MENSWNCEVEFILTCSAGCVIIYTNVAEQVPTFTITETNAYVPVVTLSTQDNAKLLPHDNNDKRISNKRYFIPNVEIKDYNVIIDGKNHQPVKNNKVTYENIRKNATGQGDDYTIGCFLDYIYFKKYYKMIATYLSKQQALDADPKAIQQINFTANLDRAGRIRFYFIFEEAKETVFEFSEGTVKVL